MVNTNLIPILKMMKPRLREVKQLAQGHTALRGTSKQSAPQSLLLTSLYASASSLRRALPKSNFHSSGCSPTDWYRLSVEDGAQARSVKPCSDMLNATGRNFPEHLLRDGYPTTCLCEALYLPFNAHNTPWEELLSLWQIRKLRLGEVNSFTRSPQPRRPAENSLCAWG